ncbi:MAG: hypothetical protein M1457_10275 [bacterium]|nr:hypothetical protein [bacterium]
MTFSPRPRLISVLSLLICLAGCGETGEPAGDPAAAIQFHLIDQASGSQAEQLTVKDTTTQFRVAPKVLMDGRAIATVESVKEPAGDRYNVRLGLTQSGAQEFADLTGAHANQLLAIVADGQIVAAAQIPGPILDGTFMINGRYTEKEAADIVAQLDAHLRRP